MKIIEKYNRHFEYASILMNIFIAFQFYRIWLNPTIADADRINTMILLIVFEFIMVHSGVLMSITPKKISLFALVPFYGLFAWGFNFAAEDNMVVIIYLIVVFNRMRFAFSDVPSVIKQQTILKSILAALAYFILIFVFLFGAKYVPRWGMTSETMLGIGYYKNQNASGLIVEMPHIAMAFAFVYYCILAIIEAFALLPKFGTPFIKYVHK